MSAAEAIPEYLRGWCDGAAGRALAEDTSTGTEQYTMRDIVEAYQLGRRVGRDQSDVDAEAVELAGRISRRLLGEPAPRARRHLRLVD